MLLDEESRLFDCELSAPGGKLAKLTIALDDGLDDPIDRRALCLPVSEKRRVRPRDEQILVLARIRPPLDDDGRPIRDRLEPLRLRALEPQAPDRIHRGTL